MKKYKIKVDYKTGNSLHQYDTEDYLELSWDNLDVARENLKAIAVHYKMYRELEYEYSLDNKYDIVTNYKNNWWFVDSKQYSESQHCMKLKADNGNLMQQNNFWCGYFESLYGAEITSDTSDMKFTV